MEPYSTTGPLPTGTVVLEASAGTGKTFTIASLAARYVAEARVPIDRLLILSFSRSASRELRARVRARFVELIAESTTSAEHSTALRAALSDIDRAPIMTIHEFCQQSVGALGVLARVDPRATLVEEPRALVDEAARDLYLARYGTEPGALKLKDRRAHPDAAALAESVAEEPQARLVPEEGGPLVRERVAFARALREETSTRKHRLGVISFDDQLARLHSCLVDPHSGEASKRRLRAGYHVVLVDEFQDTDPLQWQILQLTFDGHLPLVLVGDPKQAIYTFRGADVNAYQAASRLAVRQTLADNHRSDGPLVDALQGLLGGLRLGEGIDVQSVNAVHQQSRLHDATGQAVSPLRLRVRHDAKPLRSFEGRPAIVADLVDTVASTLASGLTYLDSSGPRPLRASDLAILVRTNKFGTRVTAALRAAGLPVAFGGNDQLVASDATRDWITLLDAMANPRARQVRAAMKTSFFGRTDADLARADADTVAEWSGVIRHWDRVLSRYGVAALFVTISGDPAFAERVLGLADGERLMTDLRHTSQLLHEAAQGGQESAAWLAAWLRHAREHPGGAGERTRRLETDADAVQVMTVHGAKGLQFPVVLLPEVSLLYQPDRTDEVLRLHEHGERLLDVGGRAGPGRPQRLAAAESEDADDALRTLYVALTRAQCQVVCWWVRVDSDTDASPLHRVLFNLGQPGSPALRYPVTRSPGDADPTTLSWLQRIPGLSLERITPATVTRARPQQPPTALSLPTFPRVIDHSWTRTSYTALTAGVHADQQRFVVPEVAGLVDDEPAAEDAVPDEVLDRSPLADLPGGTRFGTLVHAAFEATDLFAPEEGAESEGTIRRRLTETLTGLLPRMPVDGVTAPLLASALVPATLTPLGPLTQGRTLAQFAPSDQLAELSFDLPLADGAGVTVSDVADLIERHLAADDPLVDYPAALRVPELLDRPLRGFLTGSIDAVFRVRRPTGDAYVVADYKTNRVGAGNLDDYAPDKLIPAMVDSHYPLQALLYGVALHRFLTARLAGYRPQTQLGGVLYLFVRGMPGAAADPNAPSGVFSWAPPPGLTVALSRLLSGDR